MHPDSVTVTGFCTPDGLYQWHRMPMGIRNGPPHFQRCMNKIIVESGMQTCAGIFIDDLGSGGVDHTAAAANLNTVMQALEDRHVLAGADKLGLGEESMAFLGYQLKAGELHCDPAKTDAISRLVPPETRSHLRAFLGLAGYYRHFIKGFAAIARPLYALLKETSLWSWGEPEQVAFDALKSSLCAAPVLKLPQPDRPYTLTTDYSALAISAILEQKQEDAKDHVIAYASKCCSDAESKYGSSKGEFLAVVYGC